jgi:hypothetical protein
MQRIKAKPAHRPWVLIIKLSLYTYWSVLTSCNAIQKIVLFLLVHTRLLSTKTLNPITGYIKVSINVNTHVSATFPMFT